MLWIEWITLYQTKSSFAQTTKIQGMAPKEERDPTHVKILGDPWWDDHRELKDLWIFISIHMNTHTHTQTNFIRKAEMPWPIQRIGLYFCFFFFFLVMTYFLPFSFKRWKCYSEMNEIKINYFIWSNIADIWFTRMASHKSVIQWRVT